MKTIKEFFNGLKERLAFWRAVKKSDTIEQMFGEWTSFDRKPNALEVAAVANGLMARLFERVNGLGVVNDVKVIVRDRTTDAAELDGKKLPKKSKEWSVGVRIKVDMLDEAANLNIDGKLQEGVTPPATEI